MTKVFNGHDHLVTLGIVAADGTRDGIHIQPYARITLPAGYSIHPNSLVENPKVKLEEEVVAPQQVVVPVAVVGTTVDVAAEPLPKKK